MVYEDANYPPTNTSPLMPHTNRYPNFYAISTPKLMKIALEKPEIGKVTYITLDDKSD